MRQSAGGDYFQLALDIKSILTMINTQYYNSGSMNGCDGNVYAEGTENFMTALACTELQVGPDLGCGPLDDGGEQGGLGPEVLEDHRFGDADPGRHIGDLRGPVAGLGEHHGRGAQDRLPPLGRGQPGSPGGRAVPAAIRVRRRHLAN